MQWSKIYRKGVKEMSARKRPTSLTIIAWSQIVISGIVLFNILNFAKPEFRQLMEASGRSAAISVLWGTIGGVIVLISGIAMLKGLNWGRFLCLCYPPISIVFTSLLYGFHYWTLFC